LLRAVGELHSAGYELLRAVPHLADSAGGGRWWCDLVPAELVAPDRGAELADPRLFCHVEEIGYAWYPMGKLGGLVDDGVPWQETARLILDHYPRLAEATRGRDSSYAQWYAEMLRLTEPEGLFIGSHYADGLAPPPTDHLRVVGGLSVSRKVPLPPNRSITRDDRGAGQEN
jgi:hypothetical protein